MNVHKFFAFTKTSGRKFLNNNYKEKDIKILQAGISSLERFLLSYQHRFHNQLSQNQHELIKAVIQLCQQPLTQNSFRNVFSELQQYHSFGVDILVRHPEPLLSSYRKKPGRNLSIRGIIQVWRFNKFLKDFLEIYDDVNINLYHSDSKRTGIFADMTYSYLSRNSHARLTAPRQNISLSGSGEKINDMKARYPDLKRILEDGKPIDGRKLILLRDYFKRWIAESPLSKATSNKIKVLMNVLSKNTINIYFSHENVIGSYLHYELGQDIDNALIKFAGFVISSQNHAHINY
ncbi:hypothetical protein HYU21_03310 [Candidatus Woesearchaeota archaeon]|nr:hypothetical protein [Candidatus Woesearchaeota archaeon]